LLSISLLCTKFHQSHVTPKTLKPWFVCLFCYIILQNYSSIITVHPEMIDGRPGTLVIESFVVDVPEGNTTDETCYFVKALLNCNLKSLADVSERMAMQDRARLVNQIWVVWLKEFWNKFKGLLVSCCARLSVTFVDICWSSSSTCSEVLYTILLVARSFSLSVSLLLFPLKWLWALPYRSIRTILCMRSVLSSTVICSSVLNMVVRKLLWCLSVNICWKCVLYKRGFHVGECVSLVVSLVCTVQLIQASVANNCCC